MVLGLGVRPTQRMQGFFTRYDLENMTFQCQYREAWSSMAPSRTIVGRPRRVEAVRCLTEALEQRQRFAE